MLQITYQKRDGSIFQRYRETSLPYNIGDTTSMGWKVLNIKYGYNDEYYPEYQYNILVNKDKENFLKKKQITEVCKKEAKTIIYYFIVIMMISFLKSLLGI